MQPIGGHKNEDAVKTASTGLLIQQRGLCSHSAYLIWSHKERERERFITSHISHIRSTQGNEISTLRKNIKDKRMKEKITQNRILFRDLT